MSYQAFYLYMRTAITEDRSRPISYRRRLPVPHTSVSRTSHLHGLADDAKLRLVTHGWAVSGKDEMAYTVDGWGKGIAWAKLGPEMVDDQDTEWTGYQVETGRIEMVMIGDDRVFTFDPEDIHELPDDAYCRDCGQIGCTSNTYV